MSKCSGIKKYKLGTKQLWEEFYADYPDKGSIFNLTSRWAAEMEQEIEYGEELNIEMAERCFNEVDDGATGPVFTGARTTLIRTWFYGDRLREVYNLKAITVDKMFDVIKENEAPWWKKIWRKLNE